MEALQSTAPADSQNQLPPWESTMLDMKPANPGQALSDHIRRRVPKGDPSS